MNIDLTEKQKKSILQAKRSIYDRLGYKNSVIYQEIIEFLGYACSDDVITKLPSGEMNQVQWKHFVQTITLSELKEALDASYRYEKADDNGRIRYVLGVLNIIYKNRPTTNTSSQKKIIHKKSAKPKSASETKSKEPAPIQNKKAIKSDEKTAVIKVCVGGTVVDIFYGGAALYISGKEVMRICKHCDYHDNPTKATQNSIAIECIERICEKIEGQYNKVILYDKSNLGFEKCTGQYKIRLKAIKNRFEVFEVHNNQTDEIVALDKTIRRELVDFPLNTFKITDENTIENPFVELRQIFADLSDEEQIELVNYARAIAARRCIPEISEEQKRA